MCSVAEFTKKSRNRHKFYFQVFQTSNHSVIIKKRFGRQIVYSMLG
jgi:hypothetical protein